MSTRTNISKRTVVKPRRFRISFWTWSHRAVQAIFLLALVWGAADSVWLIKGSVSATRILDWFPLADPLAALEITLARRAVSPTLMLAAGLILILYVLLGRSYCAWVCPLGLILDLNDSVRRFVNRKLRRRRKRLPQYSISKSTKYWVLAVALLLSVVTALPVFTIISPISIFSRTVVFGATFALWLVVVILVAEWFLPRVWCKAICPLGAFYSLVGRFGIIQVKIDQEKESQGKSCGLCAYDCPMDIRIVEDHIRPGHTAISDGECTRCGMCVDVCVRGSLSFGLKWPGKK